MLRYFVIIAWYISILISGKRLLLGTGNEGSAIIVGFGIVIVLIEIYRPEIKKLIHKIK